MAFSLHTRLAAGEFEVGRIRGCRLHLKNNALFPWFLLVPEVEQRIEDQHQLESGGYDEVMATIRSASLFVSDHFSPEKLNVACIGNQVRQMHIHILGLAAQEGPRLERKPWPYWMSPSKLSAVSAEDPGFCPVTSLPSTTTKEPQSGPFS